jgi:phosphatidylinositol glycan class N
MVVIAYLGWAAYGATTILFPNSPSSFSTTISGVALVTLGASWTLFAIQKYPLTFYVYVVFPCYFWREALITSSGPLLKLYRSDKLRGSTKLVLRGIFVIAALQSMVVCYSHTPIRCEERATSD